MPQQSLILAAMTPTPDPTRFVLMHTSHAGNVGAAARAMKVMGFSELVLVQPRFDDVLSREETVAMASGAADILVRARIVANLDEALDGIHHACATAMTPRDFGPPTHAPRAHFATLLESNEEGTTALLNSMPKNTAIPVAELGFQPPEASSDDQLYAMAWGNDTNEEA